MTVRRAKMVKIAAALGVIAMLAAGCSSPVEGPGASAEPSEEPTPVSGPTMVVHAGDVELTDAAGAVLEGWTPEGEVPSGATVTTVGEAMVELEWADGSLVRLGQDTSFTVSSEGTRGELLSGLIWNRVTEQGRGSFRIGMLGSVVEAVGTGFVLDCTGADCQVFVFEGSVNVDGNPVTEKTWARIVKGMPEGAAPLRWSDLFAHEWFAENAKLDTPRFVAVEELYRNADPSLAAVRDTYSGTLIKTRYDCTGDSCDVYIENAQVNKPQARSYSFAIDCSEGIPCLGYAVSDYKDMDTNTVKQDTLRLNFDGTTYRWTRVTKADICVWSEDNTEGRMNNEIYWEVTPSKAEIIDGQFLVTEMTGKTSAFIEILERTTSPECKTLELEFSEEGELQVTLER